MRRASDLFLQLSLPLRADCSRSCCCAAHERAVAAAPARERAVAAPSVRPPASCSFAASELAVASPPASELSLVAPCFGADLSLRRPRPSCRFRCAARQRAVAAPPASEPSALAASSLAAPPALSLRFRSAVDALSIRCARCGAALPTWTACRRNRRQPSPPLDPTLLLRSCCSTLVSLSSKHELPPAAPRPPLALPSFRAALACRCAAELPRASQQQRSTAAHPEGRRNAPLLSSSTTGSQCRSPWRPLAAYAPPLGAPLGASSLRGLRLGRLLPSGAGASLGCLLPSGAGAHGPRSRGGPRVSTKRFFSSST